MLTKPVKGKELIEIIESHLLQLQGYFHKNEFQIILLEENAKNLGMDETIKKQLDFLNSENEFIGNQIEKYTELLLDLYLD
jgi:hypothetical protein